MIRPSLCVVFLPLCICEFFTVETSRGSVQGFDHDFGSDKSQRFYGYGQMFLGIPYATAPLREKRFTLPEDICHYNDRGEVHNATYYRPRCWQTYDYLQPANEMDEDCLYLNVLTPNVTGKYPVMVYIHGGTFTTGGADIYHWKGAVRNLVSRGVVVVTIQYRLGMIGFFTTYTENFPPNRGLYDQIVALRWVNEEIANFGGDPSRITIFGQSAGAASVSDLSLSPLSRGLFHQLIQTSGSSIQEIETIESPGGSIHQDRAKQICDVDSSDWGSPDKDQALRNCLVKATPQQLISYDFTDGNSWNAAIDGAFLPDYPENLGKSRPKYPVLIGDMLEEIALSIPDDISNVTEQTAFDKMKMMYSFYDEETINNITETMIAGYSNGSVPADNDHMGWTQLMTQMFTGLTFDSNMIRDVQWHRNAGNEAVWLFTLSHRSLLPLNKQIDDWIPVGHCSDLPYLWFYPDIWETYNASNADFAVTDYMGGLWTDFAKNGELPQPRAGKVMNYIDIGDLPSLKSNWRSVSNTVYNEELPAYLGEFPPLKISDDSWNKLKELGEKIVTKWNSMKCPDISTTTRLQTTTSKGAFQGTLAAAVIIILLKSCANVGM
ncbi:hypothetical protein PRIPAC_87297 [Pristionchus pacificus]|nr:hypothetical protein PRIPAC_87297 [Pristionchus pacificus]